MKITQLKAHPENPRKISEDQRRMLNKSLTKFGDLGCVLNNVKLKRMVGGHMRIQEWTESGAEIIIETKYKKPTKTGTVSEGHILVSGEKFKYREVSWDEVTERAAMLAANKHGGEWENNKLIDVINKLKGEIDMELVGFSQEELNKLMPKKDEGNGDDEFLPKVPKKPKSKQGDIYQLGEHRLMCGDSTNISDVEALMGSDVADMVFTDPPYNQKTEGGTKYEIGNALKKQSAEIESMCDFNPESFLQTIPIVFSKNKMNSYIFCNKDLVVDYLKWARDCKFSYNILVWKKPNAIPIGGSHRPDVEYLLTFRHGAIFNSGLSDTSYSKVLEFSREPNKIHPTMKPVEMIVNQLKISSNENSIVVDFFGGSGSTLIACHKINRKCYMMEMSPYYIDVIVSRYLKFAGQLTVIRNGKEIDWKIEQ